MKNTIFRTILTVAISVLVIFTVVKAGNITPPVGAPSAQFYTLSEIYEFITNNTDPGAPGSHDFTFSDALAGTGRTLTEVYTALAVLIDGSKVLQGTTYLGVAGTIATQTLSADSENVAAGYYNATTLSAVDADLAAGFIKKNTAIFGITGTLYGDTDPTKVLTVASAAGTYNASNLIAANVKKDIAFGVADTGTLAPDGTAVAGDCLDTKTFYSGDSWVQKTGTILTKTLSADSENVAAGYYNATTLSAVDGDLVTGNIRSGANIFGVAGDPNVVNTSSGDAVLTDILTGKKCWVDGVEVTGNVTAGDNVLGGDGLKAFTIPDGLYSGSKTATANDAALVTGNIRSGITIFGVAGNSNVVDTSSGDAAQSDILSGKIAWVDGAEVTGNYTCPGGGYTWTKAGAGSWVGVNENLDWVKEIGAASWWSSITYTYCAGATDCTTTSDNATLKGAASYTGPPGGWNGSNHTTNFNRTALQAYVVIAADSTNLGNCTADKGDLVFPDGSVWDKSAAKSYSTTLAGCGPNSGGDTWANAGGSGKQYGYANNAPSALSIADAWDGIKDLTSGANNAHPYDNDGVMDDYYDIPSTSWYSAGGTSRLPMIDEYERARKGTVGGGASLLYGTNAWTAGLYLWSAEPYPYAAYNARCFRPSYGLAGSYNVSDQKLPLWVVAVQ